MPYKDLRDYIDQVDKLNELRRIEGADWNLEIGAITEVAANLATPPALLFDTIKGYPEGFRIFANTVRSTKRTALALQIDTSLRPVDELKVWMERRKSYSPIPPREVADGPIYENNDSGDQVNLLKFPVPKWHEKDGGRYIGSGAVSIMKDPEGGWVNVAIYRTMVHDKSTLSLYVEPGRHGAIIARKYWAKGRNCPIAIACGEDPSLLIAGAEPLPWGQTEYGFAGWIKGEPIEVVRLEESNLPVPARAEIVIEGEIPPLDSVSLPEGPFGEWTGYYASGTTPGMAVKVNSVFYRERPILAGSPPLKPPAFATLGLPLPAASLWADIEKAGVTDIVAVWQHVSRLLTVISIKQRYGGHAMRAGMIAAASSTGGYIGRFIILVDDDIDATDIGDVIWAVSTRCEPEEDMHIIKDCWSRVFFQSYLRVYQMERLAPQRR